MLRSSNTADSLPSIKSWSNEETDETMFAKHFEICLPSRRFVRCLTTSQNIPEQAKFVWQCFGKVLTQGHQFKYC